MRTEFQDAVEGISRKYGKPSTSFDRCNASSEVECRDENWMYALKQNNRDLSAFWEPQSNASHISIILLEAVAVDYSKGALKASFEFTGWHEYATAQREKEDQKY